MLWRVAKLLIYIVIFEMHKSTARTVSQDDEITFSPFLFVSQKAYAWAAEASLHAVS